MNRHTTFEFCLDATVEQQQLPARHAGAARFAFNHCLATVKTALSQRKTDSDMEVPWTGFDLTNVFNAWKKTGDAGRPIVVDTDGVAEVVVTRLPWPTVVCQQLFEEAAVDRGRALAAWSDYPRTPKHGGRATKARRRDGADQHPTCAGETSPDDAGTHVHTAPRGVNRRRPRKGGAEHSIQSSDAL
jgi:hypothetical protein